MKVLLLENISGVAVSQFQEAGFEVEALKGAMDEKELVQKVRGIRFWECGRRLTSRRRCWTRRRNWCRWERFALVWTRLTAPLRASAGLPCLTTAFEQPVGGRVDAGGDHSAAAEGV